MLSWLSRQLFMMRDRSRFEPRHIDFQELARRSGRQWRDLSQYEQVELIRRELLAKDCLVDPHTDVIRYWDLLIAAALVFTGIVTPYEVIFMKQPQPTDWLFAIDRAVDVVFLMDTILQFFLKVEVHRPGKFGIVLLKDPRLIRRRYLTTWFPIDAVSLIPFDVILLSFEESHSLSGMKILRCIRLLRLMKLVRILRTSRLLLRWQNYFAISFGVQKLAKFCFMCILASHWLACIWGLVGLSFGAELCVDGERRVFEDDLPLEGVSWLTTLYLGGKVSPDNPCTPWHVYTASLYWSVMTITSIGYGDIVPTRSEEYICCVLCMFIGGVLWAYIIGSTCSIFSNGDPVEINFEAKTDLLNVMMKEAGVDSRRRQNYREYLREAKAYDTMEHFRHVAQRFSPQLKGELLLHVSSQWSKTVWYLRDAPDRLLMELCDLLQPYFYAKREQIQEAPHEVNGHLAIVERGSVVCSGTILTPGCTFHVDFIVADPSLRKFEHIVSLSYSLVLKLGRQVFFECLAKYPDFELNVRKSAMRLALSRCIMLCADRSRGAAKTGKKGWPSLLDVFNALANPGEVCSIAEITERVMKRPTSQVKQQEKLRKRMSGILETNSGSPASPRPRGCSFTTIPSGSSVHEDADVPTHNPPSEMSSRLPSKESSVLSSDREHAVEPHGGQCIEVATQGPHDSAQFAARLAFGGRLGQLEARLADAELAVKCQLSEVRKQIQEIQNMRLVLREPEVFI